MKKILTAILLFVTLNAYSQTTITAGIGGAYCFSKGENKSVFKELLISQVNQQFGRFILSAVTIAVNDSIATGYIGTGISYPFYAKNNVVILLGANILKGEKKNVIAGAGVSYVESNTVLGLHFQSDLLNSDKWIGVTLQQFVF